MPKVVINGKEYEVPAGITVFQACELAGIEIPHFCYHPRLNIAGNCRMCLVEIERSPKPVASCAMPVADGMVIRTDTPLVHKARKGVLEFLLINHPLDCPICDQGGECDLQDLTLFYGPDHSRFRENKRAVADKYLGPLISTHMTRCIHCTRCIRFLEEVAGVPELGAVERGEHMEITNWLERALTSELQGNVIDLCPVGALNSKPYAYRARSWELTKVESIDVMDAVGSNIRVDVRGNEVMRILPRLHEDVNEEWISDRSRFAYDGLKRRRLDVPMLRKAGRLEPVDWREALRALGERMAGLPGERIAFIVGDLACCESMLLVREFASRLESPHVDCRQDGARLPASPRAAYLFNTSIRGIEEADLCLLIGTNPRWEAPLINARLRKRWRRGGFQVARIGASFDLTYPVEHLGDSPKILERIAKGRHPFAKRLKAAERPMLILGMGALARPDGAAILHLARRIAESSGLVREDWNGFNVLHTAAARVGGLDLGLVPGEGGLDVAGILEAAERGEIELVYLLGADEIEVERLKGAFVVYQGSHGDRAAPHADLILPGAAYTEKNATYVNTEGRVQRARRAAFPPGEAREDWKILRAVSEAVGRTVPLDHLWAVQRRLAEVQPALGRLDVAEPGAWGVFGEAGPVSDAPLSSPIQDFYLTNPICRASPTMRRCSLEILQGAPPPQEELALLGATGTHG